MSVCPTPCFHGVGWHCSATLRSATQNTWLSTKTSFPRHCRIYQVHSNMDEQLSKDSLNSPLQHCRTHSCQTHSITGQQLASATLTTSSTPPYSISWVRVVSEAQRAEGFTDIIPRLRVRRSKLGQSSNQATRNSNTSTRLNEGMARTTVDTFMILYYTQVLDFTS